MNLKLKICGMRYPVNILEVGLLLPDFMGFIFFNESPRCVPHDFKIPTALPESIKKVGVFVNDSRDRVFNEVNKHGLDFAQLHGDEPVDLCEKIKQANVGVIKVFSIDDDFDFKNVNPYKKVADFFLFDTKGKYRGGNAKTFDWNLLNQYDQEVPFFLSGGISPGNINQLLQLKGMNLYGVDVNSGFELNPGVKDVDKIRELLKR
ncbi:MAG TPA: phosphoribosylanthranilate isomerase [Cyclobacteriaceae bacterium]|nr:phosphoribosylanthranilate isomerase [Cyclobacteriaceae bacterium]